MAHQIVLLWVRDLQYSVNEKTGYSEKSLDKKPGGWPIPLGIKGNPEHYLDTVCQNERPYIQKKMILSAFARYLCFWFSHKKPWDD